VNGAYDRQSRVEYLHEPAAFTAPTDDTEPNLRKFARIVIRITLLA